MQGHDSGCKLRIAPIIPTIKKKGADLPSSEQSGFAPRAAPWDSGNPLTARKLFLGVRQARVLWRVLGKIVFVSLEHECAVM